MRHSFQRITAIFRYLGDLLGILGVVLLLPVAAVLLYWGQRGDGWLTFLAFVIPAAISLVSCLALRILLVPRDLTGTGSMLLCALGWLAASALGGLPFVIGIGSGYLDGCFEAMSGFTTTGITVFSGLDEMPRSILFWRALTQWLGGLGILSLFLVIGLGAGGAHHVCGAESHKISSSRPVPGLQHTLRIFWGVYMLLTVLGMVLLTLEGMGGFDALCHSFTALSTGGFSPYDNSIAHYRITGHANYRLIEYTVTWLMLLGGMSFVVHYRVLKGQLRALRDSTEVRYWWGFLVVAVLLIASERLYRTGWSAGDPVALSALEENFRGTLFQVVSIFTTTGFGTRDIGSRYFFAVAKQLFLVMMLIGGCVGSTGGGIKVQRVAILAKLMSRELFRLRVSPRASTQLVLDGKVVENDEVRRVAALFFTWIALLLFGGAVTAAFTDHGALESLSGMFSALGNIGPCFISAGDMMVLPGVVKVTYIFGMLAGRLELLPVLLLFSRRAWR